MKTFLLDPLYPGCINSPPDLETCETYCKNPFTTGGGHRLVYERHRALSGNNEKENLKPDEQLVSFDVTSLFTNVNVLIQEGSTDNHEERGSWSNHGESRIERMNSSSKKGSTEGILQKQPKSVTKTVNS